MAPERVRLSVDGRPLEAPRGRSLAAALLDAGVPVLTRSSKYRRPRGVWCARGHCPSCAVRVDGIPGVRACMVAVEEGMTVEREGGAARRFDPLRAIDSAGRLFPVGFQYRWFKRQGIAWRIWESRLRKTAAEVEVPPEVPIREAEHVSADLLVVGAGPAGLAAAAAAASCGLEVVLAARRGALGGGAAAVLHANRASDALRAAAGAVAVSRRVRAIAPGTVVAGFGDRYVIDRGDRVVEVTAPASVLATGAYERAVAFPGNDRPGVLLASGLRRLVLEDGILDDAVALLAVEHDSGYAVAADLVDAGVRLAAIVDARGAGGGLPAPDGVEVLRGARVTAVRGRGRIRQAVVATAAGRRTIACDVIGMSGGWQAADELRYSATSDGDAIVLGERAEPIDPLSCRSRPMPPLQAVGAVAGASSLAGAIAQGEVAGAWAAAGAGAGEGALEAALGRLATVRKEEEGDG